MNNVKTEDMAGAAPPAVAPAQHVAYLDIGAGGYVDVGSDLNAEELAALPKGRHMLVIAGTFGVEGYKDEQAPQAGAESYPLISPLPWKWAKAYNSLTYIYDRDERVIARVFRPEGMSVEEQKANASLIATAALRARGAVPSGWPTDEMIEAGRKAADSHGCLLGSGQSLWHIFRDMLAAAPQPPASTGEREYHAALQRVGTALGLTPGSNILTDCVPAVEALRTAAPMSAQAPSELNQWEGINTLSGSYDLVWLYCQETDTIDGPFVPRPDMADSWTHWAPAEAPSTAVIDGDAAPQPPAAAKGRAEGSAA